MTQTRVKEESNFPENQVMSALVTQYWLRAQSGQTPLHATLDLFNLANAPTAEMLPVHRLL